jgi:uroporphyrinogen-III synthase
VRHRPLTGVRVVVTRATGQASTLTDRLAALGADVVAVPTIAVVEAADRGDALRSRLAHLEGVEWLVVTSANGIEHCLAAAPDLPRRLEVAGTRLAVIGPGTAAAAERQGVHPDLVPERFVAEGLLEVFPAPPPGGGRVLLAQAAGARPVLADGLGVAGWTVEVVEAYRTVHPRVPVDVVDRVRAADVITFTSASTVEGYVIGVGLVPPPSAVACIGPVTAEAARAAGLRVDAVAEPHTIDGLVQAVVDLAGSEA